MQVGLDFDQIRAGGDRDPQPPTAAAIDQIHRPGEGVETFRDEPEIDFVGPFFGGGKIQREVVPLRDAADVTVLPRPDEGQEVFRLHPKSQFAKHLHGCRVDERFRVGQDTVHIEDHGADRGDGAHSGAGRQQLFLIRTGG